MKMIRWVLTGALVGFLVVVFRRYRAEPGATVTALEPGGEEPVLGYDGMDQETLLEWLPAAALDRDTLEYIVQYEEANLGREPVLAALDDLLG